MRIGIDGRFYGPNTGTGLGRYTQRLLDELDRADDQHEYVVFLRPENVNEFRPKHESRFTKVVAPWRWYSVGEQLGFPRLIRKSRIDLMHFPHFNVPLLMSVPFVVTVHDLILNKFPTERASTLEPFLYWAKHRAYLLVLQAALRRSRHIIAVSENTKKDIEETYHIPSKKITVTYEACDLPGDRETAGVDLAERFGIRKPFMMFVGTSYPHKNLERLTQATMDLVDQGNDLQLVLVGRSDFFSKRLQRETSSRYGSRAEKHIIFTDYVDDRVLNALFAQADLYVFPSLYEGFGLPGLEAMARGVPVAAAQASCLPEIYEDAAEYFNPEDTRDMSRVLGDLLRNRGRLDQLIQLGYRQVRKYSWKRMVEQTISVYNSSI